MSERGIAVSFERTHEYFLDRGVEHLLKLELFWDRSHARQATCPDLQFTRDLYWVNKATDSYNEQTSQELKPSATFLRAHLVI